MVFVNCSSATASQDCCMNYPIMPSNDPTAYQPNGLSINPNDCTPKTTAACAVPNGTGQKYCRTNYTWDYCKAVSCNAGYTLQNGQCIVNPPTYNWTFIGFNPGLLECVVDTSWPACTNYFDECKVSPWYAYRCL
ncbi:MAG: hypothetical protein H6623_05550 [Bdellovibrionaceae bacterium]|nr:hypothetical protein [Pseudobdellovibrionaceae bacterium]